MTAAAELFPHLSAYDYAYDGSIAVAKNDLMYHDTNDAKPASSQADGGSEGANQTTFASKFAGVAAESKGSTAAAGTIAVKPDWIGEIDCSSNTFEIGDKVAACEQSNGTQLENQKVKKTGNGPDAIGYCIKRVASAATRVRVRLISRVTKNTSFDVT